MGKGDEYFFRIIGSQMIVRESGCKANYRFGICTADVDHFLVFFGGRVERGKTVKTGFNFFQCSIFDQPSNIPGCELGIFQFVHSGIAVVRFHEFYDGIFLHADNIYMPTI